MAKIKTKQGLSDETKRHFYGVCQFAYGGLSDEQKAALWRGHHEEILRYCIDRAREQGKPAMRPREFFEELEEKYPRKRVGYESFYPPVQQDGSRMMRREAVYEDDFQYLNRLGLLEPWELK